MPKPTTGTGRSVVFPALLALVVANLALRLHLLFRLNINWDEFHYLSYIHDYLRPVALSMQQTFHVHLFFWLPSTAANDEIAQITTARLVVFLVGLGSTALIYKIGRRFLAREAAMFAVLCFGSVSDVLVHGASFRPDPLLTVLVLAAAYLLVESSGRISALVGAALLLAVALQVTPKAVLFFPTVGALMILTPANAAPIRRRLLHVSTVAASTALGWVLLRLLHRALVLAPPVAREVSVLASSATKVFSTGTLFPQAPYLVRSLQINTLVWIFLGIGIATALATFRPAATTPKADALALLSLALPLTTLAFYRNSYPYYFVPLLALGAILCGTTFDALLRLRIARPLEVALVWTVILGVFGTSLAQYAGLKRNRQQAQSQVVETVHRMFPDPVPYIDRCSMISSFPKVGFFMSTWGFENYLGGRGRSLTETVQEHSPPFLLANIGALDLRVPETFANRIARRLRPDDSETLRNHYVHHWDIIFVAGKNLMIGLDEIQEFSILIAGTYTVEGSQTVSIDGVQQAPGSTVHLDRGDHTLTGPLRATVTLRWGVDLYRPHWPPIREPIFMGL